AMCATVTGAPRSRAQNASCRTTLTSCSTLGSAISIDADLHAKPIGFSCCMLGAVNDVAAAVDPDLATASARFFRGLGDPTRLAVLELLLDRPRTGSELVEGLGERQSKVSNHLACLRWCRFVEAERVGRQVTYRVADRRVRRVLDHGRLLAEQHCAHLASCRR